MSDVEFIRSILAYAKKLKDYRLEIEVRAWLEKKAEKAEQSTSQDTVL